MLFKNKESVDFCDFESVIIDFSYFYSAFCRSFFLFRYEKSATIYAETHSSFEEISLKFLQEWEIEALKTFLKKVSTTFFYRYLEIFEETEIDFILLNFFL